MGGSLCLACSAGGNPGAHRARRRRPSHNQDFPMKILALETSSAVGSIAVSNAGKITASRKFDIPRGRGAELFTALQELRPAWSGCNRVAVGIGPGSYNGLRAACALAGSLQMALGIDLVAVPSPCLLPVSDERYAVAGDARGGRFYLAGVRKRRLEGEVRLVTPEEFRLQRHKKGDIPFYRIGTLAGEDDVPETSPDAAVLALIAGDLPPADPATFGPIYLKPPHITQPRGTTR
ncbi:MAG: tRNA (adenosine(37)-N6)-threonylcarbamoyltransferase complex dimerization subunit type 1 TsaB [Chthoniobacterales bacterium]|nr:tRNA (adenosine(37)-N6)-threonylcarbamoyltransferase complex dimerization subunit type 1 TsaB [Chthoniobacterales bacterium]